MKIIIGTGISSLFLARLLIDEGVNPKKIMIIEAGYTPGGIFGSLIHDNQTNFDIGMHTLQLTGEVKIDNILQSYTENSEWIKFEVPHHDISGTIIENEIFENGPYFNLNYFDKKQRDEFGQELRNKILVSKNIKENASEAYIRSIGVNLVAIGAKFSALIL